MSEEEPDEVEEQARLLNCEDLPKQPVKQVRLENPDVCNGVYLRLQILHRRNH